MQLGDEVSGGWGGEEKQEEEVRGIQREKEREREGERQRERERQ